MHFLIEISDAATGDVLFVGYVLGRTGNNSCLFSPQLFQRDYLFARNSELTSVGLYAYVGPWILMNNDFPTSMHIGTL